jgi:Domain of unknown function (DUF222)
MATTLTAPSPVAPTPLEQLEARIQQGAANLTAFEHGWLLDVAEFDRRRGWEPWECRSAAQWLSWQVGLDVRAAREKVRVARAFPVISAAMAAGRLSYSKVRAITRIATAATEQALVDMAMAGTTNHVERIVAAHRRAAPVSAQREAAQWAARGLWHEVRDDGSVCITLHLPAEQATAFLSAVDQFASPPEVLADGSRVPRAARRADGAVAIAAAAHAAEHSGSPTSAPKYLVTLHADAAAIATALAAEAAAQVAAAASGPPTERHGATVSPQPSPHEHDGCCEVEGAGDACDVPIGVSFETALRMLCDCDLETLHELGDEIVGMSNRSSLVTGKQRRMVLARDRHCRFPGCTRRAGVDVHHLRHRGKGGKNDLANLAVLCSFHHHRVHEGGWRMVATSRAFEFIAPDGRVLTSVTPTPPADSSAVAAEGRTADDGRCQWLGERLHVNDALAALFSRESVATGWQPRTP